MMIGVLFGNFCSSCFIKISVSFYVKITFFPDFFDDLTPVAMGSYYQCSNPDSNEKNWTGHIRPLNINRNEFEVTARGSTFHLLVGKHAYGKYLCIPNWRIGTEISSLSDSFWSRECLELARKGRKLERGLKCAIPDDIYEILEKELTSDK